MSKVLVIRKTDKTIHKVPLSNEAALRAYSNRLPVGQRWTFEQMDEEEAAKLPFIDKSYVTAGEAQNKVKELEDKSAEKDAKIKELEAKIAALNGGSGTGHVTLTATETIEKINAAENETDVNAIVGADTRKTVLDAASKKIASFTAQ